MKIGAAYPSKYFKAADLDGQDLAVTITEVQIEEVGQGKSKEEKPVLYFKNHDKGLVLNKTNSKIIEKLYGDETDDWEGKSVTLYPTEVEFQGDMVESIRIRSKPARPAAAPAKKAGSKKPANNDTFTETDGDTPEF